MNNQYIDLNLVPSGMMPIVYANQNDIGRKFQLRLKDGEMYTQIPGNDDSITVNGKKDDQHVFLYDETDKWDNTHYVIQRGGTYGTIVIATTQQMTAYPGDVHMQVIITEDSSGAVVGTVNFIMRVQEMPAANGDVSDSELPSIIAQATEQMERAEAAAQHYPYIRDSDKHWMSWDAENEEWYDTGVRAKGVDGSGAVNSVDNVEPDANGNVPLRWADMSSISNLSITENTRTMSVQRVAGSYVYVKSDDQLYLVTTTIAANGTLIPNTNATAKSIGEALSSLSSDLTNIIKHTDFLCSFNENGAGFLSTTDFPVSTTVPFYGYTSGGYTAIFYKSPGQWIVKAISGSSNGFQLLTSATDRLYVWYL